MKTRHLHTENLPSARKALSFHITVTITLLLACLFLATGCALLKAKQDIDENQNNTVIIGNIFGEFRGEGPIIVAAAPTSDLQNIACYTVLHGAGEYEILVDQGKYYVFAFRDENRNLIYDAGEPAAQYGNPKVVEVPSVGVVFDIDITVPEVGEEMVFPTGTKISPVPPGKLYSRQAGAVADLDDERFSGEHGVQGFWEPFTFFRQFSGNIYFLEAYDPDKTPILFIHGATGTPRGWKYFVDHIDRTRFQPWFYYYPSGARIESMAYLLLWKLSNLQSRYHFDKIYITAHSMGGLVARSFIVNYGTQFPFVKLFISLATPWGGDKMAEYGVAQSPVVIPSWIDMQPNSDFIKSLYRKKLPQNLSFYMFYGHRGNRNPLSSNNDGTINLSSLLDYRPQKEAAMNFAFNEDHETILSSPEVVAQYNAILQSFAEKEDLSRSGAGGYLKVHFDRNYVYQGPKHNFALILRPDGKKKGEIITFLEEEDNGKTLGPFTSGSYVASMVTMAAKTTEQFLPVTIEKKQTKELDFTFMPDGMILGCVTAPLDKNDEFVGRPDYRYRSADADIQIRLISLQSGITLKTPRPETGPEKNDLDYLIKRDDICYNNCFAFFDLAAGDHTLTVEAEGYKTLNKTYTVTPGIPVYFRVTELTPD